MCPKSSSGAEPRLSPPQSGFKECFLKKTITMANQKSLTAAHLGGQSADTQHCSTHHIRRKEVAELPKKGSTPLMEMASHGQAS